MEEVSNTLMKIYSLSKIGRNYGLAKVISMFYFQEKISMRVVIWENTKW